MPASASRPWSNRSRRSRSPPAMPRSSATRARGRRSYACASGLQRRTCRCWETRGDNRLVVEPAQHALVERGDLRLKRLNLRAVTGARGVLRLLREREGGVELLLRLLVFIAARRLVGDP